MFKPTRLYVKRHRLTGMRYFGKTVREDIYEYAGSGTYWTRHINKHGIDHTVTDWVSDWFYDVEEIKDFALSFSELFDIVESDEWANKKPEDGLDGGWPEGMTTVIDMNGNKDFVDTSDPRLLTGELVGVNKGTVVVRGSDGSCYRVSEDDPRWLNGELISSVTGYKHPIVECPHCGQMIANNTKNRYHFDACPENPNATRDRPDITGENNPMYGKTLTDEQRAVKSKQTSGINNPFALVWDLTSPAGENFVVYGALQKWCDEMGIKFGDVYYQRHGWITLKTKPIR